jgi:asparagine synthase (glutamine-hydrolysing)
MSPDLRRLVDPDPLIDQALPYDLAADHKSVFSMHDSLHYLNVHVYRARGLDARHPFTDRRLVEYMLSVPGHVKMRPPYMKLLLRSAMQGILPERVRMRPDKGEFSDVYSIGFRKEQRVLLSWTRDPLVAQFGFVGGDIFREMVRSGLFGVKYVGDRNLVLGLEQWLRCMVRCQLPDPWAGSRHKVK